MNGLGGGLARRDFLRTAGVLGAVGTQEMSGMKGMESGSSGGSGRMDISRFDPTKFLRDFDYGETRQ